MFKRYSLVSLYFLISIALFSQFPSTLTIQGDITTIKCIPQQKKLGQHLSKEMDMYITAFQKQMGVYPDEPVTVILSPNADWYEKHTFGKREIVQQANAFYNKRDRTIILRTKKNSSGLRGLKQVFLHEYIHYYIDSYIANAPLWFHEGMAVYFSGQHNFNREVLFTYSYLFGDRASLMEMRRTYPESKNDWEAFYAVSSLAVKTLYKEQKPGFYKFWYIAEQLKSQGKIVHFSKLFNATFFMTTSAYDKYFENIQKNTFLGHLFGVLASFVGPLLTVFLIIAYVRKRKEYKLLTKRLDEEEQREESDDGGDSIPKGSGTEESTSTEQA